MEDRLNSIIAKLNKLPILELRQLAREVGVLRPAVGKKERLVAEIVKIARGEILPVAPSTRGAPVKSSNFDKEIYAEILEYRQRYLNDEGDNSYVMQLCDVNGNAENRSGVLFKDGGKYFLYEQSGAKSFVGDALIGRFALKEGDKLLAKRFANSEGKVEIGEIISVNDENFGKIFSRPDFETLVRKPAQRRVGNFCLGQRVMYFGSKSGVNNLSAKLAEDFVKNSPDAAVAVAYICGLPEIMLGSAPERCERFFAGFERGEKEQLLNIRLAAEYAKRQVELKKDALIILDGVMKLCKSFNEVNRRACSDINKILAAAGDFSEGGSLTVVMVTEADESVTDSAILSEFSKILNETEKLG